MHKWAMSFLVSIACIVGLVYLFVQVEPGKEKGGEGEKVEVAAPATIDAAAAEAAFKTSCVACHGGNLEGGMGGKAPALKQVGGKLSYAQIHKKLENGGGGMPGFKGTLKDDELANLSGWLSTLK
ncbi:c-type cytochrome [Paenibacillus sp. y28]|uniref:c-type cytochrome n=1 Tax=Paenibacillus sp. y28 TaxID=3129110 RepID=UPI0030175167